MRIKLKIMTIVTVVCGVMFSSCDNYFDVSTDDMLDVSDSYKEKSNVFAGLIGLSASFRELADHHIILTELLGDQMQPTSNAPDESWDVYRYKGTNGNSFASPAPYYKLIVNCNDFLKHAIAYHKAYPSALTTAVYGGMISSALSYRAWAYLQLGKIYGEAIYYDVVFTDDNKELPSKVMKLDELVEELIYNLKTGVDGVNGFQVLDWGKIISPQYIGSDYTWSRVSVDANVLLCELYLWAKDYTNAARTGLNYVGNSGKNFKLSSFDGMSQRPMWSEMFENKFTATSAEEACTYIPFDFTRQQTHKLQYYFSSEAPNVYYFAPHINSIFRFQEQIAGMEILGQTGESNTIRGVDMQRYRGTISYENGARVVSKYSFWKIEPYQHDAPIFIYRAPEVYLMVAEALSGLGGVTNIAAADSMINVGLKPSWKTDHFDKPFDAPIYSNSLSEFRGIRGRAGLKGDYIRYHIDTLQYPGKTETEKVQKLERGKFVLDSLIAEETALELAYEGKRWFTLMRIARNTNNPQFLANEVAKKFPFGESQYYKQWLQNPENWFVKWNQTQVLNELKKEE